MPWTVMLRLEDEADLAREISSFVFRMLLGVNRPHRPQMTQQRPD